MIKGQIYQYIGSDQTSVFKTPEICMNQVLGSITKYDYLIFIEFADASMIVSGNNITFQFRMARVVYQDFVGFIPCNYDKQFIPEEHFKIAKNAICKNSFRSSRQ